MGRLTSAQHCNLSMQVQINYLLGSQQAGFLASAAQHKGYPLGISIGQAVTSYMDQLGYSTHVTNNCIFGSQLVAKRYSRKNLNPMFMAS
mmetsp:Transcript_10847/g.25966  ORF Transcript_10847/g.25966 Transcript_10847/m.25966 type:complete len:90 (+) Transcript_10847:214-483(+)